MTTSKERIIEFYVGSKKINCYPLKEWPTIPEVGDTVIITTTKGTATLEIAERLFDYVTDTFRCGCTEKK